MAGTFTSLYPIVATILVFWAAVITWRCKRTPPLLGLLLAVAIYLTSLGSVEPLMPLALGTIILAVIVVSDHVRREWDLQSFFIGLTAGVAPQVFAAFTTFGAARPGLMSLNASQVAQTGLVFWLVLPEMKARAQWLGWLPAAVQMAVSVSRVPLFVAVVYFALKPTKQRAVMLFLIIVLFIYAGYAQGQISRVLPPQLIKAAELRLGLISSPIESSQAAAGSISDSVVSPEFEISGFGFGNYINHTGLVRPHNVFILMFFEMGILALIPVLMLGWAVFTRRLPMAVFIPLFILWQFTEEANGRVEGFFTTAAVLTAVWRVQPPKATLLAAIRQRLQPAK